MITPLLKKIAAFVIPLFAHQALKAQNVQLQVQISKEWLQPGDTLDLSATYKKGNIPMPPATLVAVVQQAGGQGMWKMRWPMIDGVATASLVFPKNLPPGKYTLITMVQPRFFRLYGQLADPAMQVSELTGSIRTFDGREMKLRLPVDRGAFMLKNVYFEHGATFALDAVRGQIPYVRLDAWLDSAYTPVAVTAKELGVGINPDTVAFKKIGPAEARQMAARFTDPLYSANKLDSLGLSPLQKFDSLYVTAPFKEGIDTVFDCMNNAEWNNTRSFEDYLAKQMPGFRKPEWDDFPIFSSYKGNRYIYFLDEKLLNTRMLPNLNMEDIAQIKVFNAPFKPLESVRGNKGGGIAIYTRKGVFANRPPADFMFTIQGYQPPVCVLLPEQK